MSHTPEQIVNRDVLTREIDDRLAARQAEFHVEDVAFEDGVWRVTVRSTSSKPWEGDWARIKQLFSTVESDMLENQGINTSISAVTTTVRHENN